MQRAPYPTFFGCVQSCISFGVKFFNGRVQHVTWTYPPTQNLFCLVTQSLLLFVNGTAGATARYGYRKKDDCPGLEVPQSSMLLEMAQLND